MHDFTLIFRKYYNNKAIIHQRLARPYQYFCYAFSLILLPITQKLLQCSTHSMLNIQYKETCELQLSSLLILYLLFFLCLTYYRLIQLVYLPMDDEYIFIGIIHLSYQEFPCHLNQKLLKSHHDLSFYSLLPKRILLNLQCLKFLAQYFHHQCMFFLKIYLLLLLYSPL